MRISSGLLCPFTIALSLASPAVASAAETDSGFLQDYSQLKPVAGTHVRNYAAPNAYTEFKNYTAIMIDQPEFVIAADSKYRGIKPDDAKAIADAMRKAFTDAISKNMKVVDKPGPGVLYLRMAASNVHLKKKKRGLLSYTPAGFVVTEASQATQELEQKIVLQDMMLEMEVMDSQSQAVLAAAVDNIGADVKKSPSESWGEEKTVLDYWASRFSCRLANTAKPETEWQDCVGKIP
jgi:hypothetical protein